MKLASIAVGLFFCAPLYAQNADLQSRIALKDSVVARYNRGDFHGVYSLSSESFRRYETEDQFISFLKRVYQAGPVVSSELTDDMGDAQYFTLRMAKINVELTLSASRPRQFDILAINRLLPYDTAYVDAIRTDNHLQNWVDSAIDKSARRYLRNKAAAGVTIGVIKNGKIYKYNYGVANKEEGRLPTAETYYEIGSITKTFAGTILAQAALEGRINLHDDIRTFLPDTFPNLEYKGRALEVVNLANHTSGMPSLPDDFFKQTPYDSLMPYSHYSEEMFWNALHQVTLDTIPGIKYEYSNYGMALLGYILERAYGKDLEALVKERITDPLNMPDTKFTLADSELKRFAVPYNKYGLPVSHWDANAFAAAGGIRSTLNDLLSYLDYQLSEKNGAVRLTHELTTGFEGNGTGLNWSISTTASGRRLYQHNGATGGFRTIIVFLPEIRTGFVLLTNSEISIGNFSREITYRLTKQ